MRQLFQGLSMATVAMASVMALAAAAPAQAAGAPPSDSLIIFDATGAIFEAVYGFELGEDATAIHTSTVAIDATQFGNATTLTERNTNNFSDIVGICTCGANGAFALGFASDSETQSVNYGTFPRTFLEHGPIDVTLYLDPSLRSTGWTATFTSDGGVPEPATWAMMLTGFGGLGALMRRRRALAVAATA